MRFDGPRSGPPQTSFWITPLDRPAFLATVLQPMPAAMRSRQWSRAGLASTRGGGAPCVRAYSRSFASRLFARVQAAQRHLSAT